MFLLDIIDLSVPVITRLEPMVCGLNTWKGSLQKLLKNIPSKLSIIEVYWYLGKPYGEETSNETSNKIFPTKFQGGKGKNFFPAWASCTDDLIKT